MVHLPKHSTPPSPSTYTRLHPPTPISIHLHPTTPTYIRLHPSPSTYIQLHPPTSAYIRLQPSPREVTMKRISTFSHTIIGYTPKRLQEKNELMCVGKTMILSSSCNPKRVFKKLRTL